MYPNKIIANGTFPSLVLKTVNEDFIVNEDLPFLRTETLAEMTRDRS